MKKNVNLVSSPCVVSARFKDTGKSIPCRIDNFPADNPAYKKRDGFRCNDVSLLDKLSFGQVLDEDLVKIVASRVKEQTLSKQNDNLSELDLVRTLRPSWCQTASEVKQWEESVYNYISTTAESKDVESLVNDVKTSDSESSVVSPVSDSDVKNES